MSHPYIKKVTWHPKKSIAENCLEMAQEKIDSLQAVVDAAVIYIHAIEAGHHGPLPAGTIKQRLKNLHAEVAAFEEREQ